MSAFLMMFLYCCSKNNDFLLLISTTIMTIRIAALSLAVEAVEATEVSTKHQQIILH